MTIGVENFGALVTCYDEIDAVKYSLKCFRKIYPTTNIYLITESKDSDYSSLLEFDNISINHVEDTMYFIPKITDQNFLEPHFQEKILFATTSFLNRVKKAIEYCKNDYLLLMDPDTLVRGPLSIPQGAKLLGSRINSGLPIELRNILSEISGAIDIDCWGATPAIIHCDTFLKSYKYVTEQDSTFLPRIAKTFYAVFAHDVILPILFALQGEYEIFNPDIIECNRFPDWTQTDHPLVHQFKHFYKNSDYSIMQQPEIKDDIV
jgi:hypothetical protein